jgi:phage head maturation protease
MNVQHKDATIQNTDDTFPGSFEVVLSTKAKDRDGDELQPEDWKQPLPDHITFDADHGMSVATTVGSGTPTIDESGRMVVRGTYSSLPRAQEVRTLVNEGHIRTTSVAFMTEKSQQKDGTTKQVRELLNGAFVAIPSNREALVLASKGIKAGARNSKSDADHIQAIHDHALALGAKPAGPEDDSGAAQGSTGGKALAAPAETATASEDDGSPEDTAAGLDAVIDQALALIDGVDVSGCPEEVQQALALLQAADVQSDELLDEMGVPDPDEDDAKSFDKELQVAAMLAEIEATAWTG